METSGNEPRFVCDAMLGGLARRLRFAGYDATWMPHIDDWDLIRLARAEERVLLSSDTGIFLISRIKEGRQPALRIPNGLTKEQQLAHVLEQLHLLPRSPRCTACNGFLIKVAKEQIRDRVPQRSFEWQDQFWQCSQCSKVFWQGTHWQRMAKILERLKQRQSAG
jgi:uncharacterized protein with PIN domain